MEQSNYLSLNWHDLKESAKTSGWALVVGLIGVVAMFFYPAWHQLELGQIPTFDFNWGQLLSGILQVTTGVIATFVGNIIKRFKQGAKPVEEIKVEPTTP